LTVESEGTSVSVFSGIVAGNLFVVTFDLQNPPAHQSSPSVSVSAEIQDGIGNSVGSITASTMIKPETDLYGIPNGANPLEVVMPQFSVKSIEQSTPVSGASNMLSVTLMCNYDLASGSTVTITGLTGSQTEDTDSLAIASTSGMSGAAGQWIQSLGQLVLTVASGGTKAGLHYSVTFGLTNSATDQMSPSVSIGATILGESGETAGSCTMVDMDKPGTALYGVPHGADPLTVQLPQFIVKSIEQLRPVSGETNTLTITLMANYVLLSG
jgi:hypothetical protein